MRRGDLLTDMVYLGIYDISQMLGCRENEPSQSGQHAARLRSSSKHGIVGTARGSGVSKVAHRFRVPLSFVFVDAPSFEGFETAGKAMRILSHVM